MKLSIQYKVFAAILCAALAVAGYMAFVIQWSFDREFLEYVDTHEQQEIKRLAQLLEGYYEKYQGWETLVDRPLVVLEMHALTLPEGKRRDRLLEKARQKKLPDWIMNPREKDGENHPPRHPIQRTLLLDSDQNVLFGQKQGDKLPRLIPIMYQGTQVGSLGLYSPQVLSETHQVLFVKKQKLVILMVGIAAVFITIGISLPLSYHLTKPIRRISQAANQLISGDYSTRIHSGAKDELGRLSQDINTLAATLEENETQRKQWVSDIAHELRTPLTSLRGEIEALQDGIRKPNQRTYDNLHQGVMRLSRLVEDLYDLSRSDLGTLSLFPEQLDFHSLMGQEIEAIHYEAERAGVSLILETDQQACPVHGDKQRLQQLVSNLLTNSVNYTDEGGEVRISIQSSSESIQLDIQDTAPGVPDEALPRLFNRLYRVDQSRNRRLGGSGLGLTICLQIVKAHNGTITARHASTGGLWIQVILPTSREVA